MGRIERVAISSEARAPRTIPIADARTSWRTNRESASPTHEIGCATCKTPMTLCDFDTMGRVSTM